jgi:hypothetical protein
MRKWDHEVDLVSIGADVGGLAGAITTVDAGYDVLVANAPTPRMTRGAGIATRRRVRTCGWLVTEATDAATADYLGEFAAWLPGSAYVARDAPVPTRIAGAVRDGEIEPFIGSRLRDWAGQCLTSPYGVLCSRVFARGPNTMRSADGGTIEVLPIGSIAWRHGMGASALREWMAGQARDRGVDVLTGTPLERLVFDDGRVVGAVFGTADGPLAVRARRGISLAPAVDYGVAGESVAGSVGDQRQVCLVGRTASSFGRVEVVSAVPTDVSARQPCSAPQRSLRSVRSSRSGLGHCRKVD